MRNKQIEVLHWQDKDSQSQRCTLVMRYLTNQDSKNEVVVYHKGSPAAIKEICSHVYSDQDGNKTPLDELEQEHFDCIKSGMCEDNLKLICVAMRTLSHEEYVKILKQQHQLHQQQHQPHPQSQIHHHKQIHTEASSQHPPHSHHHQHSTAP